MTAARLCHNGTGAGAPPRRLLRAGPLTLSYGDGELRYVRLGDREVVRRWHTTVRDHNWGTIPPRVLSERWDVRDDAFRVELEAENRRGAIDFQWTGVITGDADGTVTFRMDGLARSTFLRNRIGFCVLHPIRECAGAACRLETGGGAVIEDRFPDPIAPENPFRELRSIAHEVLPETWAELRFEGDLFETEDQRNWIDASFKTFCTPLRLPFPVEVAAGARVQQVVALRLLGRRPEAKAHVVASEFAVGDRPLGGLPRLGLSRSGAAPTPTAASRLRSLRLSHLRTEIHLGSAGWAEEWDRAVEEARALGVPLEAALFVTDDADRNLAAFARVLEPDAHVCRWMIHHESRWDAPEGLVRAGRRLGGHRGGTPVVAGTHGNFAELNRNRPPVHLLDGFCYSAQPQEHASDDASLVETPAALADTVATARTFCGEAPLSVAPITLRKRVNPYATGPEPAPAPDEPPARVDPRQASLLGAAWTIAAVKALAEAGAASATFYETVGWLGVMECEQGCPLPERFPSRPGMVFPLYHVLADLGELAGAEVLPGASNQPLAFDGLALRTKRGVHVLLANLTHEPATATVDGLGPIVRARILDETTFDEATRAPEAFRGRPGTPRATASGRLEVALRPFAYIRLDSE